MHVDTKKSPLDRRSDAGRESRAKEFAKIERQAGAPVSAKEMAMLRRPRDEKADGIGAHLVES